MTTHISENEAQIAKLKEQIEAEKALRSAETDGEQNRQELVEEHKQLTGVKRELREEIRIYEKCDPEKLEQVSARVKTCQEAANRWTDNLFELESWIKK